MGRHMLEGIILHYRGGAVKAWPDCRRGKVLAGLRPPPGARVER